MSVLENLKAKLGPAEEKFEHGIDKAAQVIDEKTKGKYSDKIHTGTDKAKHAMERLAHKGGPQAGEGTSATPPESPPPSS